MDSSHWKLFHQRSMPYSSIQSKLYLLPPSSGNRPFAKSPRYQALVSGDGSGMKEQRCGCHCGLMYQMPVRDVHYYCTVDAKWPVAAIVNAVEQGFTALLFVNARGRAQTTTLRTESGCLMSGAIQQMCLMTLSSVLEY